MSELPSNLNVTATRRGTEPNGLTYWVNYARTRPPEAGERTSRRNKSVKQTGDMTSPLTLGLWRINKPPKSPLTSARGSAEVKGDQQSISCTPDGVAGASHAWCARVAESHSNCRFHSTHRCRHTGNSHSQTDNRKRSRDTGRSRS